ncbi:nucleotidyltransferase domain-containing protein [Emydomyces testavorans]|uniref:Nucleotidyltransferase domain-containing protein n=1 Tax=Emydomyces testavorans TaxID=2070801 RepID=A0AAF0DN29_9EURO|nr:nucleotidyltransferase domain-containing protein [Emydomyces testavorans]
MASLRPAIPHHLIQAECFYHTSLAQITRPAFHCNRQYHTSPTLGRNAFEPPIIPSSLKETLEAHRDANRQKLIRHVLCEPTRDDDGTVASEPDQDTRKKKVRFQKKGSLAGQRSVQASSQLGLETLDPPSKKRRLDIRPHGAISLFRKLVKKSSARLAKQEWTEEKIQCPWMDYLVTTGPDGFSRLDDEITAVDVYMSPIPQEEAAVDKAISDVTEVLQRGDHPQPLLIGSQRTGLAMRHSNVDLLTIIPDPDGLPEDRGPSRTRPKIAELQLERQEQVSRVLRGSTTFTSVDFVRSRVPIVTAVHDASGLPLTLHCSTQLPTCPEFIHTYNSEFPTLRPLLTVLRLILEQRNLFGPQNRTVNTYTLAMMIVAALKLSEGRYSRTSTAEQLLHVLHFYATANFRRYGIAVDPPSLFRKRGPLREASRRVEAKAPYVRGQKSIGKISSKLGSHMLCLQDPANYMNDLGLACFRTMEMQKVFGEVYADLGAAVKAWDGEWKEDSKQVESGEGQQKKKGAEMVTARMIRDSADKMRVSMLMFALGGDYDRLERMRDRIILGAVG